MWLLYILSRVHTMDRIYNYIYICLYVLGAIHAGVMRRQVEVVGAVERGRGGV